MKHPAKMRPQLTRKVALPYVGALKTRIFALLAATETNWRGLEVVLKNDESGGLLVGVVFGTDDGLQFASAWFWATWDNRGDMTVTEGQSFMPDCFPNDKMPPARSYVGEWLENTYHEVRRRRIAKKVSSIVHQELVAAVWRPDRVASLLEKGGWDAVEMLA